MKSFFFALFVCLIIPASVSAQAVLSEIMYDPVGIDGGFEWIEIQNTSESTLDITNWKILENATNHRINEFQGGVQLATGSYAVVADNPANFLLVYPHYSGLLFDSAFSLNNTGESLALVDENAVTVDSYSYSAHPDADGTGKTLQRNNNQWVADSATPGSEYVHTQSGDNGSSNNTTGGSQVDHTEDATSNTQTTSTKNYFDPYYTGGLVVSKHIVGGVASKYSMTVTDHRYLQEDTERNDGYFVWNMGDGTQYTRTWNESIEHTYSYPGEYILVVDWYNSIGAFKKDPDISLEKTITAETPLIGIKGYNNDGALAIHNATQFSFDISGWSLEQRNHTFTFPNKTYLPAGEVRYLLPAVTGFTYEDILEPTRLVYPNGKVLHFYNPKDESHSLEEGQEDGSVDSVDVNDFVTDTDVAKLETASKLGPVQSDLSALALFSQGNQSNALQIKNLPWWLWCIAVIGVLTSLYSVYRAYTSHVFHTKNDEHEMNVEQVQK